MNSYVWPELKLGQTLVNYFDYLILFGGDQKQSSTDYEKSNLWLFDTALQEWFLIKPDNSTDKWPVNFNQREFMSVDAILNKGIILYTGGATIDYSQFNEPIVNQTSSDNEVLILNIEFII